MLLHLVQLEVVRLAVLNDRFSSLHIHLRFVLVCIDLFAVNERKEKKGKLCSGTESVPLDSLNTSTDSVMIQ